MTIAPLAILGIAKTAFSLIGSLAEAVKRPADNPAMTPESAQESVWHQIGKEVDVRSLSQEDLAKVYSLLYDNGVISLQDHAALSFDPSFAGSSGLLTAADASGRVDWMAEFQALFGDDDDELLSPPLKAAVAESASPPVDTSFVKPEEKSTPSAEKKEMDEAISGAFDHLFNTSDDDLVDEKTLETENNVDGLMSSDETLVSAEKKNVNLDERLNTRTLAEIYFEQGLFDEALSIYKDLAKKEPNNAEIAERLTVIEQKRSEKLDKA